MTFLQNILTLLPIILVILVLVFIIKIMLKSKKLDPIEIGKTLIAKKNCSGIIGGMRFQGPFIQMRFYEDFLVISYYKKIILKYVEITPESGKLVFYQGLLIKHENVNYPKKILLYVDNIQEVINYIEGRKKILTNAVNTI